jgi:hypothetical protein
MQSKQKEPKVPLLNPSKSTMFSPDLAAIKKSQLATDRYVKSSQQNLKESFTSSSKSKVDKSKADLSRTDKPKTIKNAMNRNDQSVRTGGSMTQMPKSYMSATSGSLASQSYRSVY